MIFFDMDSDPTEWFMMPLHWTSADNDKMEEWAFTCSEITYRKHVKWWRGPSRATLAARFRLLAEAHPHPSIPADQVFLWAGDPRRVPQPVYALAMQSEDGDREGELRILVQATEKDPVFPPNVESFRTDRLGEGLRCLQYFGPRDNVGASLNYGWWAKEVQAYVSVRTVSGDIGWLTSQLDIFDDFARSISVTLNPTAD